MQQAQALHKHLASMMGIRCHEKHKIVSRCHKKLTTEQFKLSNRIGKNTRLKLLHKVMTGIIVELLCRNIRMLYYTYTSYDFDSMEGITRIA